MPELLIYNYRIPVENVKYKRIYQFSDTHLTCWDFLSSEEEKQRASARTEDWIRGRVAFAKAHNEPCGEAQALPAEVFFQELLETCKEADALIMAGDIVDFYTDGNARLMEKALRDYPTPYIALRGNHDEPDRLPTDHPMKSACQPVQKLDLGDMVILGFDDSDRVITPGQIESLRAALQEGKPVLLSMHVPVLAEGNAPEDDYFYLNYEGCPKENLLFLELIRENAHKIIALTCGHLHFLNVAEVCAGLTQYVSSQGLTGSLSVYEIGEIEV